VREILKIAKLMLLAVVGYALGYMQGELKWLLSTIGLTLPILFLALILSGLVWAEFSALGLGFSINGLNYFYIFAFCCVVAIAFIRQYEKNGDRGERHFSKRNEYLGRYSRRKIEGDEN
jgi:hypothetical protein